MKNRFTERVERSAHSEHRLVSLKKSRALLESAISALNAAEGQLKAKTDAPIPKANGLSDLVANVRTDAERLAHNCSRLAAETE